MTDADVRYIIRFAEHIPTSEWDAKKKRIACFIANCWDLEDKDKSWKEIESLDVAGLDLWLKRWDGELNIKGEKYVHMIKYEVYGRFLDTAEAMHSGMREFFPNVDYEFVCFVCDSGYAEEYVTIVVNGKRFDKEIIFHEIGEYLDDDYDEEELEKILSQGEFEKPEPTDDNPYSVPGDILLGEDEYLKPITGFWK